jgi:hypothetical protein
LNFSENKKEFQFKNSELLFQLSSKDEIKDQTIQLGEFGGAILKLTG